MTRISTANGAGSPVYEEGAGTRDACRTLYVHLHDGAVAIVTDVSGVAVSAAEIEFARGSQPRVSFPRSAVYFTCRDKDQPPPQF